MSATLGLFRLQQVDSRISQVETRLAGVRERLGNDAELRAALEQVKAAEAELAKAERDRHKSEEEAESQQIKIQQTESTLYGGGVHNPKELQDLQADTVSLKKHLATLEEHELEAMLKADEVQAALKEAKGKLKELEARLGNEHLKLVEQQEALERDLENLQTERSAAVSAIASEMLAVYEELRQQRRGVAVAEVSDNACSACGTTLTAALQQNARHAAQIVHCPSCGRILYAG